MVSSKTRVYSVRRDLFLAAPPIVDWRHLPNPRGEHALLLLDPDDPAPRTQARRFPPGARGPGLLWLVTDIRTNGRLDARADFSEARAVERVAYRPPDPPGGGGARRLAFARFRRVERPGDRRGNPGNAGTSEGEGTVSSASKRNEREPSTVVVVPSFERTRWDVRAFMAANPTLEPKAFAAFYCARE